MPPSLDPGLYIVATPIGNLSDLGARAAAVLAGCDLVLAEDKRVTAKLLRHIGSKVPMQVYNDHSDTGQRDDILTRLEFEAIALVSDAGTPLISDPGFKLVRAARAANRRVTAVPGPCAAIAALTLAGLPTDRFLFLGFLPPKDAARAAAIDEVATVRATLVLYESGPRIGTCLAALARRLGPREAAVAREITKLHEECVTGTLEELAARYDGQAPKGEIVIVIGPPADRAEASDDELDAALIDALTRETSSRAASEVAQRLGIARKRAYARALDLEKKR